MKKILIALTIAISCLGINKVSADTFDLVHSDSSENACRYHVTDYDYLKELGYSENVQQLYNLLMDKYNTNYSSQYPYYYIELVVIDSKDCNQISSFNSVGNIYMFLSLYNEIPSYVNDFDDALVYLEASYDAIKQVYNTPYEVGGYSYLGLTRYDSTSNIYNPLGYFISNFDLYYNGTDTYSVKGNSNFTINPGDILKPIFTAENAFQTNHIEINLNDYAYVALALKNYQQKPFETTVHVKGQYCITPVYGMGLETYEDMKGTKVQNVCTPYYDNYTPVKTYITKDNISYYSIYYVKAYDTTRDNYIKVDTSLFDISYITEENKNNPYVLIQGKTYPTIPYDELPSSATQNTEEGYIPGQVEEFSFSDIFTAPLEFLKDIWDSIVSVFDLVKEFFSLLPEPIPTFLFVGFTLAIALGIIKIIL